MKCNSCGAELPEGSKFCSKCGLEQNLSFFCKKCGTKIQYNESVCPNCGELFEGRKITVSNTKTVAADTDKDGQEDDKGISNRINKGDDILKIQKRNLDDERIKRKAELQAKRDVEDKAWQERMKNSKTVPQDGGIDVSSRNDPSFNIAARIYNYDPSMDYNPISMWGYFVYSLVFAIPLIGLILTLIFAFGGTSNINLRNFARSQFCYIIVLFIFILMFGSVLASMLASITI